MSDLNLFQQICVQIFTANLCGGFGGSEKLLQKVMNKLAGKAMDKWLKQYGWKITWGPRVWKSDMSPRVAGLDNCWMISMAPGVTYPDGSKYDTYVVAIAGTAVFSKTDWAVEDFGVNNVISFDAFTKTWKDGPIPEPQRGPKPVGDEPLVAYGTAWGTYQLVTNTSPDGNPGEKTTILHYLAGLNKDGGDFRVIFAGHSLGGALSPFLSLGVKANALIPALAEHPENILTFPAAGATPGDDVFRDAYKKLFPISGPGGYQTWNADFYNSLDIVPQAWSTDDNNDRFLDKITSIYGNLNDELRDKIQMLVNAAKNHAAASDTTYEPIEGNNFEGKPPEHPPSDFGSFIGQAIKQHTIAYFNEVKVGNIIAELYSDAVDMKGVERKTARQAALDLPVLSFAADKPAWFEDGQFEDIPSDINTEHPYDCIRHAGTG